MNVRPPAPKAGALPLRNTRIRAVCLDGQRYDPINTEGNSTFEIPVSAFDTPLEVIADTVAMSEPHEVAYTLTFVYASMEDA